MQNRGAFPWFCGGGYADGEDGGQSWRVSDKGGFLGCADEAEISGEGGGFVVVCVSVGWNCLGRDDEICFID